MTSKPATAAPEIEAGRFYRLHFDGECSAIGAGRRVVFVETIGVDCVVFRCPRTLRAATLITSDRKGRAAWSSIQRTAWPAPRLRVGAIKRAGRDRARTVAAMAKTERRAVEAMLRAARAPR